MEMSEAIISPRIPVTVNDQADITLSTIEERQKKLKIN